MPEDLHETMARIQHSTQCSAAGAAPDQTAATGASAHSQQGRNIFEKLNLFEERAAPQPAANKGVHELGSTQSPAGQQSSSAHSLLQQPMTPPRVSYTSTRQFSASPSCPSISPARHASPDSACLGMAGSPPTPATVEKATDGAATHQQVAGWHAELVPAYEKGSDVG